jgi:anti-sigma B factor antagonist
MSLQEFKPAYFTIEDRSPIIVAVVTRPRLCEEDNIEQFGVELNQLIDNYGCLLLVLNLQQVTLITSSAVGKLIALHRNLHRRDGRLALCGVEGMIRNVFQTAKLIDYFHITPDVDAAVELLARAPSTDPVRRLGPSTTSELNRPTGE